ncbi:hypothetical protein Zmor_013555 [Zophobas morio]|uniref:Sodium channel protein Nach n=1 Tax=Zophobas morio TaxID=2755281 RepID=A0AA38IFV2_9CUCU|nr:hypothetical protein Zmor_013555 [Zophobas morio]
MSNITVTPNKREEVNKTSPVNAVEERKNRPLVQQITKYYSDFMNNSTIHGFKYLVDKEKSFIEKIWWICILTLSIYTCAVLIKSTWRKWEENPVFIALRQKSVSLWDIPFPAVTVCHGYLHSKKSIATFLPIESENTSDPCKAFSDYQTKFPSFKEPNASEILEKTAFSMDDIFSECFVADFGFDLTINCSEMFSPIFTDAGLCFSFNMLNRNDIFENFTYLPSTHLEHPKVVNWSIDDNYSQTDEHVYPQRVVTTTNYMWFSLKSSFKELGCDGKDGFKIILHHPAEIPTLARRPIYIEEPGSYDIGTKLDMTFTSNELKFYSPERRKCLYSYERRLYFFKIYTMDLCRMECLANYTLHFCHCVPFYMPHNITTNICGRNESICVGVARTYWLKYESGFLNKDLDIKPCDCLPSCTTVTYSADVVQTLHTEEIKDIIVSIRFREWEFMALERQELFGDVNFWASCGGLLGLFTGFSVISLAEMVYYLTLRWLIVLGKKVLYRLKKDQEEDVDIGPLFKWKEDRAERPAWSEISDDSLSFKALWAQWDSLCVENVFLKRARRILKSGRDSLGQSSRRYRELVKEMYDREGRYNNTTLWANVRKIGIDTFYCSDWSDTEAQVFRSELHLPCAIFKIQTGNLVWLYNLRRRKGPKLSPQGQGPYTIVTRINDILYRTRQGPKTKLKIVYLGRLMKYSSDTVDVSDRDKQN